MKKLVVEFIATFFLILGAAFGGAIGASLVLLCMIYAGGHISGADYNPAVSIAKVIRKKLPLAELPGYLIAQFLGGILAALLMLYVLEFRGFAICDNLPGGLLKPFVAEVLGTFALVFVILNVGTARSTAGNSYFGLAISATVLAMATLFAGYTPGVFNPAVGLGLSIHNSLCWQQLWLFFAAPITGGLIAAYVFLFVNGADDSLESIPDERTTKS